MDAVLGPINAWKDLITKVFGAYPLAAAFVTLLAVAAYFYLDKILRPNKKATNILLVLLAWAVAVPILGGLLGLVGEIWGDFKAIVGPVVNALDSFYSIYQKHPLLVLSLVALAILAYFAWKRWRPNVLPSRFLRFFTLAIGVFALAHALKPIVEVLMPEPAVTPKSSEGAARLPAPAPSGTPSVKGLDPTASPVSGPPSKPASPTATSLPAVGDSSLPAQSPQPAPDGTKAVKE